MAATAVQGIAGVSSVVIDPAVFSDADEPVTEETYFAQLYSEHFEVDGGIIGTVRVPPTVDPIGVGSARSREVIVTEPSSVNVSTRAVGDVVTRTIGEDRG